MKPPKIINRISASNLLPSINLSKIIKSINKIHRIGTANKNRTENNISAKVAQSSVCPCLQLTVATVLFLIQSTLAVSLVILYNVCFNYSQMLYYNIR